MNFKMEGHVDRMIKVAEGFKIRFEEHFSDKERKQLYDMVLVERIIADIEELDKDMQQVLLEALEESIDL
jgi:glycogen debranching enzyme